MNCQHNSFGSREPRAETPVWFQPIVDTFAHRVLAHQCLLRSKGIPAGDHGQSLEAAEVRSLTIRSAARQAPRGLYFVSLVPSSIDDPELDMRTTNEALRESGMQPGNLVFEVDESDLARDPAHSHRIRDYLRSNGFGFALSSSGVGAFVCSFEAVSDFDPDYVNLDKRLIHNIEHPVCAPTIGKLVRLAERSGACVISEGVDRARIAEDLWLLGVRFMQGHLFGDAADHVIHAATLEFAR
jgi:EAL domain-containing protein (putative c-di-GMP-specific phosphodiesterase class I)